MDIKNREAGTIGAVPAPETTAARPPVFVGPNADPGTEKFTYENREPNYLENRHPVPPRRRRISFNGGPACRPLRGNGPIPLKA